MGQVCCIGHIDSRSEHLMLHTFSSLPANKVQVFTATLSTLVQCLCSLSLSLSYLVVFSTTCIIFVVGRGTGGPWATVLMVTAICPNPVQLLKVE